MGESKAKARKKLKSFKGARPGMAEKSEAKPLRLGKAFRVGSNYWYLSAAEPANGVLKVRGGVIQEIGLASRALTGTRTAQERLLHAFPNG